MMNERVEMVMDQRIEGIEEKIEGVKKGFNDKVM